MNKVLCFGSLNIDFVYRLDHFVQKGETISSESMKVFSGGKGLNQSIALAKAGADTSLVTVLPDIRTGHAIIQNDREGDNCIILFGGANQAITHKQIVNALQGFEEGDWLVLQNEISELSFLMKKARERGLKIVLNPSPMNEIITGLPLEDVAIFMLNEIEACQLLGLKVQKDFDGEELARKLHEKYPTAAIVLTMGSAGSVYLDEKECIHQDIYKVKTVDTTSAGDTFTGFFIGGLIRGLSAKEAMDEAAKASAVAVSRPGASPSIPTLEEIKMWHPDGNAMFNRDPVTNTAAGKAAVQRESKCCIKSLFY